MIPPGFTGTTVTETASGDFAELIYAYRYDGRRRLVEKKIPGKGWEYSVYNRNDQLVLTQDAVQRSKQNKEWSYTKYDAFGRVTERGIYRSNHTRTVMQDTLHAELANGSNIAYWDTREVNAAGYDNKSYPRLTAFKSVLTINYYDTYDFKEATALPTSIGSDTTSMVKGLLTGTRVFWDGSTSALLTVNYYDKRTRLIQTIAQNHLNGIDRVTNTYNFPGELLTSIHEHIPLSGPTTTVLTTNSYDRVGRLVDTRKKVNAQTEVLQSRLAYNEVGQLKTKSLHSENNGASFMDAIDYGYNERGWTTRIGSSHFTQVLAYNAPSLVTTERQYNGNISEQQWGHGTTATPNFFVYTYDRLNRLLDGTSTGTVMSEVLTYDDMGNIRTLRRDGGATITYTYDNDNRSNRLRSLSGNSNVYTYDVNVSATKDRLATVFTYNHLSLPKTAVRADVSVGYLYDGTGTKLRKTSASGATSQRDYVGGIEYNKVGTGVSAVEMIHTEEGYLQNNGGTHSYHYNLTDHLGNVRATLQRTNAGTGTVIQKHDYYPFGKARALVTSGINRYLYNGKELQPELGDQLDYGARFYDPEIGRWNVVDPLADHYRQIDKSPYAYAWNNPARLSDPDGRCPECEEFYLDQEVADGTEYVTSGGATYAYSGGNWTRQGGQLEEVTVTASGRSESRNYGGDGMENPLAVSLRIGREIVNEKSNLNDKLVLEAFTDINMLKGNEYFAPKVVLNKQGEIVGSGVSILSGVAGIGQTQTGMYLSTKLAMGISSLNVSGSISRDGTIGIRVSSGISGSPISSGYNLKFTPGGYTGLTAIIIATRGSALPSLFPLIPQLSR